MIRYDDMQIAILIANLFSTAACIVMVVLGFVRKKENLVKGQAIQLGLLAVSNTLLQAYSGTIGNIIGVIRCYILPKAQKPLFWKIGFIAVQFVITLPEGTEMCMPGDNVVMNVELITPIAIEKGLRFAIREGGRTVGSGVVTEIYE